MHTADDAGKNSGRTSEDQSCRQRCGVADIQHRSLNRDAEFGGQHRHTAEQNTADQFDFSAYDYVVDAIDSVTGKLELVRQANCCHTPIISSMGAGNKLDPTAFEVADIYQTSVCPLARVMRRELRKMGIAKLKVVYSKEPPLTPASKETQADSHKRPVPGSTAFVPSVAGLILAGTVIQDLIHGTD